MEYRRMHGRDLIDVVKSETSFQFQNLCKEVLLFNEGELDAYWINKACDGAGTSENMLVEVLVGRSNQEIQFIIQAYRSKYGKELASVLKSELSGNFESFFINGVLQGRAQIAADVITDVTTLYKAGEKKIGTDENKFINIFCTRPVEHLRYVFDAYQRTHGKPMTTVVKSEFSGSMENALLETIKSVYSPAERVADYFYEAMQGLGTNDDKLRRLVVMNRSPRLMPAIKAAFLRKYQKPLASSIKAETSGDYEKLLVDLIGEI